MQQLGGRAENLSLNFWVGTKGTGDFVKEVAKASRRLPSDAATREAAEAAAAAHAAATEEGGSPAVLDQCTSTINGSSPAVLDPDTIYGSSPAVLDRADDALFATDQARAMRGLLAARHVEGSVVELLGSTAAAGQLLGRLARGEDAAWYSASAIATAGHGTSGLPTGEGPSAASARDVAAEGADPGNGEAGVSRPCAPPPPAAAARHALRMRAELIALLGSAAWANAVLRAMTRHGRLLLSPPQPVEGSVVNSEAGQLTPIAEYRDWLASDDRAAVLQHDMHTMHSVTESVPAEKA